MAMGAQLGQPVISLYALSRVAFCQENQFYLNFSGKEDRIMLWLYKRLTPLLRMAKLN